jgi:hypothetical protein
MGSLWHLDYSHAAVLKISSFMVLSSQEEESSRYFSIIMGCEVLPLQLKVKVSSSADEQRDTWIDTSCPSIGSFVFSHCFVSIISMHSTMLWTLSLTLPSELLSREPNRRR